MRSLCCVVLASLLASACAASTVNAARAPETPIGVAHRLAADGERFARQGDLVRAQQYLASAWHSDDSDPRILRTLLHVCLGASRLRVALSYAEPYLLRHPHDWPLRYVLASIELGLDRPERARSELLRVVEDAPTEADAYYLLATLSRAPQASTFYAQYLALAPEGNYASVARDALQNPEAPETTP
jgi:predicted Zn-dependent protease